ncbi:MAG TPA: TolC family protein [Longimicrobium sp.]|jgi:outer membrane protein TolC|uniref:TolC family protein n=1 Tax=Longimicrobium sp. TaxID=2029185 RepID=UPI002ED78BF3
MRSAALAFSLAAVIGCAASGAAQTGPVDSLVTEAIRANRGLQERRYADARSEAAVREAAALGRPSISLDARYSRTHGARNLGDLVNPAYAALNQLTGTDAFPTNVDARLPLAQETRVRVAQPLYRPAIGHNVALRRSLRGVQGAELGAATRQLAADVQSAWLRHAQAARVVQVYASTLPLLAENLRVAERLVAAGKATPDAVYRARAELGEAEQQRDEAEQQRGAAARFLNYLVDRPLDTPVAVPDDSAWAGPLPLTLDEARARALAGREELRGAEQGVRAAEAQGRIAAAGRLPTVSVALDYGIQGNRYELSRDADFAIASVLVQWSPWEGGQTSARRQGAALEAQAARVRRADAERRIDLEVRQAYEAAVVARAAIATAADRVAAARRTFELVARKYQEGAAPQIEYLDVRAALTRAELNLVITRHDYALRRVELERAAALRTFAPEAP